MTFNPEKGILFSLNGREFVLSPESDGGQRLCMAIDDTGMSAVVPRLQFREVMGIIEDVFRSEGQPAPRIGFARFPDALDREWDDGVRGFALQPTSDYRTAHFRFTIPVRKERSKAGGVLDFFAWFCIGTTCENIRAAAADLRSAVRDMRKNRCGRLHVLAVRFWITTMTIVPIAWDGCVRISKKLPIVGAWVRAVSAFLRKIDPPRLG